LHFLLAAIAVAYYSQFRRMYQTIGRLAAIEAFFFNSGFYWQPAIDAAKRQHGRLARSAMPAARTTSALRARPTCAATRPAPVVRRAADGRDADRPDTGPTSRLRSYRAAALRATVY